MTTYFVTRHPGALEWATRQGIDAELINHLDAKTIRPGDIVLGTLPVNLAAQVCAAGGRYFHLSLLDLPSGQRGRELTVDDMEALSARLMEYQIQLVGEQ